MGCQCDQALVQKGQGIGIGIGELARDPKRMQSVLNGACAVEKALRENRRKCELRSTREVTSSVILGSWTISSRRTCADLIQRDSMQCWFLGDVKGAFFSELGLFLDPFGDFVIFGHCGGSIIRVQILC